MIKFKKDIEGLLPYNREKYIEFLDDDFDSLSNWQGISFQLNDEGIETSLEKKVEVFESLFKNVISKLDNDSSWIVNHDDKDLIWFPDDKSDLKDLRALFKRNNVKNSYIGALIFMMNDLYSYAKDLISYPYMLSYKNLDISHSEIQFVIKITSHLTIDLLCTDTLLLKRLVNENSLSYFAMKKYR